MGSEKAQLSIRIDLPNGRFGPGKAALLCSIADAGSISGAARALNMSYARAWSLTEDMNALFKAPLIETFTGGAKRGGARLTDAGTRVLALYDRISARTEKTAARELEEMTEIGT